jgi:xanthine dehydrogenase accessory factor
MAVIQAGRPKQLTYGISDDQAFEVGLTCGRTIHLFVEPSAAVADVVPSIRSDVVAERRIGVATLVEGPEIGAKLMVTTDGSAGSLGDPEFDRAVTDDAKGMMAVGESGVRSYGFSGERRMDDVSVFAQSFAPKPNICIFGAIDFASALCKLAKYLGSRVTVCDPREVFATAQRFPDADEIIIQWPHEFLASAPVAEDTAISPTTPSSMCPS